MPRQNGKNAVIEIRELYGMAILGEKFLHTAHEVKTARKAFLRIASFFENERKYPELAALVKEVRKTNGQEAVVLTNGGQVEFIARSRGSGRGFTVDVLVCDEAQDLTDEALAALLPTIAASPSGNPQFILTGTPPDPDKSTQGEVWKRVRADGESKRDARLAWTDYGAADGPLPDIDDEDAIRGHNPSIPELLSWDEVERERRVMAPARFAAERMGWWGDPVANTSGIMPNWPALGGAEPADVGAIGIATSRDREWASIAAVSSDGTHLAANQRAPMGPWLLAEAKRIALAHGIPVALDNRGGCATLADDLREAGVWVHEMNTTDYLDACDQLFDAVRDGAVNHGDYPELTDAVQSATWRDVGKRRAFAGEAIDMLEAATCARHAALTGATATVW